MVALDLPTVAFWQYACYDAVAAYSVAGYCWPSNKRPPTNCNYNSAKGLPYTYRPWCNHFFSHMLHTCIVCFFVAYASSSKWAEEQCSQVICATVQPYCRAPTAASMHYFRVNYKATCFKYFVYSAASSSDRYSYSRYGLRDRVSATIFSGPCQYSMVMGNSFILSSQCA